MEDQEEGRARGRGETQTSRRYDIVSSETKYCSTVRLKVIAEHGVGPRAQRGAIYSTRQQRKLIFAMKRCKVQAGGTAVVLAS